MKNIGFTILSLLCIVFFILPSVSATPDKETIEFTLSDGVALRESNVFVQGSTIRINVHTPIQYNVNRLVAFDYLFVIEDPLKNPVHISILKNRSRSYIKESSVQFSKSIPQEWIDGEYTVKIFIIERTNPEYATKKLITTINPDMSDSTVSSLDKLFSTTDENILIDYDLMRTRGDSFAVEKKITFTIDREAKQYFIRSVSVPESVPPESSVNVIVTLENIHEGNINDNLIPVLNGESLAPVNFDLPSQGTMNIEFEIPISKPGENILNIGSKTAIYRVDEIPLQPTEFIYNELRVDRPKILKGDEFNVSVGVFNLGENGTLPVVLLLNDQIEATKNVSIEYGKSEIVTFNVTLDNPGIYQAKIQGKDFMKIIVVQDKDANDNSDKSKNRDETGTSFISSIRDFINRLSAGTLFEKLNLTA